MTVLRSRKVLPTVSHKWSQTPAPDNMVAGPGTPSKTTEGLNPSWNSSSPSSSSPIQSHGYEIGFDSGDGSILVSECGIVRRVSARLAKKVGTSDCVQNVKVVSAKRKKVEGTCLNGDYDEKNMSRRDSNGISDPVKIQSILQDMGEGVVTELIKEKEEIEDGGSVAKETITVETVNNGKRKRRLIMEVKDLGLESRAEDEVVNGFLSLRSGRRVVKRGKGDDIGCAGNFFEGIENRKDSGQVLNRDELLDKMSEVNVKEENGFLEERRFSMGKEAKGKGKISSEISVSLDVITQDSMNSTDVGNLEEVVQDEGGIVIETGVRTRRRMGVEEKKRIKLGGEASTSRATDTAELKVENLNGNIVSGADHSTTNEELQDRVEVRDANMNGDNTRRAYRERFRRIARRNASRFAHFSSQDELGVAQNVIPESDSGLEDWPGPFSTAMKIIKDREGNKKGMQHSASGKCETVELKWIPKNHESHKPPKQVPSLMDLCLSVLSRNADAITSLDFVPDSLRHKICWSLCDSRRMSVQFLELLVHGSPTEIRVPDCSWLSEELFTKIFEGCDASKLTVLQFDQCGICMPDYTLHTTLAHSPNSLPSLTTISLKGAYRLSDAGLHVLASSAPSLKSIDVSQCPLLTSEGICCLASSLRFILRELYLDNCHGIDGMVILPALEKLGNLEVLSVSGIQTVSDDFVCQLVSANGCRMKELVLADCMELTDSSIKVIGDTCSDLRAVDLTNLFKLTDISIGYLANGCRAIQTLKLCRNAFSDEAIAAYLDVRGASLRDLVLNNITQVSNHTAVSLARNCRNLRSLDLSWCRNLTNEALGLIVDSCILLEVLKMFGCTQVTSVFLDGHSNAQVKVIGLKMRPVLKDIQLPNFLVGPLRYP